MSTTHSSFDQYCISHKTIGYRATGAFGPEVHRECPMAYFPALPLLATNPGDATGYESGSEEPACPDVQPNGDVATSVTGMQTTLK